MSPTGKESSSDTTTVSRRKRTGDRKAGQTKTRASWSRDLEAASAVIDQEKLEAACDAFLQLSKPDQLRFAREIVETRRHEYTRLYRNVIAMTAGHKQKQAQEATHVTNTTCVIFVVRRKWSPGTVRAADAQALPKCIYGYWVVAEQRVLCAIPTDVVTGEPLYQIRSQALTGVRVSSPNRSRFFGNVACAVKARVSDVERDMVLSCLHVFSPIPEPDTLPPRRGATVTDADPQHEAQLAVSAEYGGALRSQGKPSFDAQLARITNPAALHRALLALPLSTERRYIRSEDAFAQLLQSDPEFHILVSPNHPERAGSAATITAKFAHAHPDQSGWDYRVMSGNQPTSMHVTHSDLIDLLFTGEATREGDSGSPVVVVAADGNYTFVGMHIGASPTLSVIIPAWQLFDATRYGSDVSEIVPFDPQD